ncbi:hypothetical protein HK101_003348, partial [Irineochytrium annulatum]
MLHATSGNTGDASSGTSGGDGGSYRQFDEEDDRLFNRCGSEDSQEDDEHDEEDEDEDELVLGGEEDDGGVYSSAEALSQLDLSADTSSSSHSVGVKFGTGRPGKYSRGNNGNGSVGGGSGAGSSSLSLSPVKKKVHAVAFGKKKKRVSIGPAGGFALGFGSAGFGAVVNGATGTTVGGASATGGAAPIGLGLGIPGLEAVGGLPAFMGPSGPGAPVAATGIVGMVDRVGSALPFTTGEGMPMPMPSTNLGFLSSTSNPTAARPSQPFAFDSAKSKIRTVLKQPFGGVTSAPAVDASKASFQNFDFNTTMGKVQMLLKDTRGPSSPTVLKRKASPPTNVLPTTIIGPEGVDISNFRFVTTSFPGGAPEETDPEDDTDYDTLPANINGMPDLLPDAELEEILRREEAAS